MKYYIHIVGCAMNYSDAERISAALESLGFKKAKEESEADLLLAVACSVRQSAVDRIYSKGRLWKKRKDVVTVLSGCVLLRDKKKLAERFDFIFDIKEIDSLEHFLKSLPVLAVKNTDNQLEVPEKALERDYLSILPSYESPFRAFVPIMTGCDNFCSYCAVPYVRGREKSRAEEEILTEIKSLVAKGYKEITLLGQNVNSYQAASSKQQAASEKRQVVSPFVELINKIDQVDGDYRVYFYSNHPKDISDELIKTLPGLKHFPNYLHLPLQSGSDEILKKMNRHYTKNDYLKLVAKIKKNIPGVALTTDVMVGFPGETKEQFEETKEVMQAVGFEMAFLAQYSPRSETASAKLEDGVPRAEKKRREADLQKILGEQLLEKNKKLEGKVVRILIDSKKNVKYYGRTDSYKVVEITQNVKHKTKKVEIGQFCNVKIVEAGSWKIIGEIT